MLENIGSLARSGPLRHGEDMPELHARLQNRLSFGRKLKVPMTKLSSAGNLGPSGTRQRLLFGTLTLAAASGCVFWLEQAGVSRWWRIGVFPLLWLGVVGLLQARARTCIAFAARGTCDRDADIKELTPEAADFLRQRARSIARRTTLFAAILTLLAIAAP